MDDRVSKLYRLWTLLKQAPKKHYAIGGLVLFVIIYVVAFFVPKAVQFSYAGETCASQLTLLPSLQSGVGDEYEVSFKDIWTVGSVQLAATKTCFTAKAQPNEGIKTVSTAPFGGWIARKHFRMMTPAAPVASLAAIERAIPATKPLEIPLSAPDTIHEYTIKVAGKQADCETIEGELACDIPSLKLNQGASFDYALTRSFKAAPATQEVGKGTLKTLKAVVIKDTSVKPDETVYRKTRSIEVKTDKAIDSAKVALTSEGKPVEIEQVIDGVKITVTAKKDLPREKPYELTLKEIEATDKSTLIEPHKLSFTTSGGPKVANVSVGATGVAQSAGIVLTFDQNLSKTKDITSFIKVAGGAAIIQKRSDTQVLVQLADLPLCQPFSITVGKGMPSEHDIATNEPWTFNGRVTCMTTMQYGTSLQGRPLVAYLFGGSGPVTMYTGAIHGNESSSSVLMHSWVQELEANPARYEGKRILVVPTINPDGLAVSTRTNSRGVNLSRNFPTDNWTRSINDTDGRHENGGGESPLSEPEAAAIAKLTTQYRPRLLISFHAIGSLVIGDPGGYSAGYAAKYASSVRYRDVTYASTSSFDYDITGAYEDWSYRNAGIPSMVVELSSYTYASIGTHRSALWAMLD